jgi:anthranilate synthase component I
MTEAQFQKLAKSACNRIAVQREVLADTETPLSTYLKLASGEHSYFFESVQGGEKWGRYSIIGLPCSTILRVVADTVTVEKNGKIVEEVKTDKPFEFISSFKNRFTVAGLEESQRFSGGLVGYFSYDSVRFVETSIGASKAADEIATPDILLMLSEEVVVFDNLRGTICFVITVDPARENAYREAQQRLDYFQQQLARPAPLPKLQPPKSVSEADFTQHFSQADYQQAVAVIKDYIVAGDVMQVVLAQRMSVPFSGDPLNVYRALRFLNPSPYMVYFDLGDHHVVSASPEILARVEAGKITGRDAKTRQKRSRRCGFGTRTARRCERNR